MERTEPKFRRQDDGTFGTVRYVIALLLGNAMTHDAHASLKM
jgi:hypothetical protein